MPLRKLLLRLMLWSLGFTAVAGAALALLALSDVGWRIIATGVVTSLCAGVLMPVSGMLDRPASRAAGLVGMWAVVVEFGVAMLFIWLSGFGDTWGEAFFATLATLPLAGVAGMAYARMLASAEARAAGGAGLVVTAVAFGAMMAGAWLPIGRSAAGELWEVAWAVAGLGVLGTVSMVTGPVEGRRRAWRYAGVAAAGAALVMSLVGIVRDIHSDMGEHVWATLLGVAVVCGHANLALRVPLTAGSGGCAW